jgi:hypothetical protein
MQLGLVKRVLVVCPLSIMYSAWQADIFKTAMHRTVGVAYGDASKRKKIINGEYEFVVINFDGVNIVQEDKLWNNLPNHQTWINETFSGLDSMARSIL